MQLGRGPFFLSTNVKNKTINTKEGEYVGILYKKQALQLGVDWGRMCVAAYMCIRNMRHACMDKHLIVCTVPITDRLEVFPSLVHRFPGAETDVACKRVNST